MKKTFLKVSLFTLLGVAAAASFTGCKDYDGDIDNLQNQIDNLKTQVEANNSAISSINSQVSAGAVISNVEATADGIKITLSNGKSYTITNGKDGVNGTNGTNGTDGKNGTVWTIGLNANGEYVWYCDGEETEFPAQGLKGDTGAAGADGVTPVISIGENGNWYINGEDTGIHAQGEKGETGEQGPQGPEGPQGPAGNDTVTMPTITIGENGNWYVNGEDTGVSAQGVPGTPGTNGADGATGPQGPAGANGANGANGNYYVPNAETGCFDLYSGETNTLIEHTNISWKASAPNVTVVDNGYTITLYGLYESELDPEGNPVEALPVSLSKSGLLRGLVYNPQLYYQGIEAIPANTFNYEILTQNTNINADSKFPYTNADTKWKDNIDGYDKPWNTGNWFGSVPSFYAEYFTNPSNVNSHYLLGRNAHMSFYQKDTNYSRTIQNGIIIDETGLVANNDYQEVAGQEAEKQLYVRAHFDVEGLQQLDPTWMWNAGDEPGDVTVVALNIKFDSETAEEVFDVTSDWAAIKRFNYDNIHIFCPKQTSAVQNGLPSNPQNFKQDAYAGAGVTPYMSIARGPWYLWQKWAVDEVHAQADATEATPDMLYVVWNEQINLGQYVQTIAFDENDGSQLALDGNATDGSIENYGFYYTFELIGYVEAENATSQSAFAAQDPENQMIIQPQKPDAAGKAQAWNADLQSESTIGRMPMVRVTLKDKLNNDQIVTVAYIPVYIAATAPEPPLTIEGKTFTKGFTVGCEKTITVGQEYWNEVQFKLLNVLGISKAAFEANYSLDAPAATPNNAYVYITNDPDNAVAKTQYGTVIRTTDDVDSQETEVLKWTWNETGAWNVFKNQTNPTITIFVRYIKTGTINGPQYVYVPFTWTPNPFNANPTATLVSKITNYWYESFGTNGTWNVKPMIGWDKYTLLSTTGNTTEARVNTWQPEQRYDSDAKDITVFEQDINAWFVTPGMKLSIDNPSVYADYVGTTPSVTFNNPAAAVVNAGANKITKVTGVSGKTYTLVNTIVGDNSALNYYAVLNGSAQVIATYDPSTNVVAYNHDSDYALDILNNYAAQQLNYNQEVTVPMIVSPVYPCTPVKDLAINNAEFSVRFLRPITVDQTEDMTFTDAGLTLTDEIGKYVNLYDWRNINFNSTNGLRFDYFGYYDVEGAFVGKYVGNDVVPTLLNTPGTKYDITEYVTTTLNSNTNFVPLKGITNNILISYTPAATPGWGGSNWNLGVIEYKNNGSSLGQVYKIKAPFFVKYYWGYVKFDIVITIDDTLNN